MANNVQTGFLRDRYTLLQVPVIRLVRRNMKFRANSPDLVVYSCKQLITSFFWKDLLIVRASTTLGTLYYTQGKRRSHS